MFESEPQADDLPERDFVRARAMCVALRDFLMDHEGGHRDESAIRTIRVLADRALEAASDPVLTSAFARMDKLALALYSEEDHQQWARLGQTGTTRLKLLMMRELIRVRSHLSNLEASSMYFLNGHTGSSTGRIGTPSRLSWPLR